MHTFAIIPARGGSKRIPGKNIRSFLGVPILKRVIQSLNASELFDSIIVSTDSDLIAEIAVEEGAAVPFVRPPDLADDYSSTADVVNHAIRWILASGADASSQFLVAYPTAVMVTSLHLRESRLLLDPGYCDLVFAGARFPGEIQRAWWKTKDDFVQPFSPEYQLKRSQDLTPAYFDAGQFYWSTKDGWSREVLEEGQRRRIFEIDLLEAIDINTHEDWRRAEILFKLLRTPALDVGVSGTLEVTDRSHWTRPHRS